MVKVLSLGKSVKAYIKRFGRKRPLLTFTCETESCHSRVMYKHGHYLRIAVTKHQHPKIPLYRWRCSQCKITLTILPHFLTPGKHFVTSIREAAIKRKLQGHGFDRIAKSAVSDLIGSIHPRTIKRWWQSHLQRVGKAAEWLASQLIQRGINEDLLRLHSRGVNPTPCDTAHWFTLLAPRYITILALPSPPSLLAGYFSFLNTQLPIRLQI